MRPIKVLVMSVGEYKKNGTAKLLEKIGAVDLGVIVLPKCYEENAESYKKRGFEVYIYDEKKYINDDFEFFGFKPRNCGGVGRQGIAEAVEKYGDDFICLELDDDTSSYRVYKGKSSVGINDRESLVMLVNAFDNFYDDTGIEIAARTGATPHKGEFLSSRKRFNNFIMKKGNAYNFIGFRSLTSDDYRYGIYRNLMDGTPLVSVDGVSITFTQNQGDRNDGNAVIYNGDYSWKKSYALKMMMPWGCHQLLKKEEKRYLFRENLRISKIYPPICLEENGKIVGRLK